MITVYQPMSSLLVSGTMRFATLWTITRSNGTILRFTDHNRTLTYLGNTYTPAGSLSASSRSKEEGTAAPKIEVRGILDSTHITHEDLRTGLYRNATILEQIVDWMYPWAGTFYTATYYVEDVQFDGEVWTASIAGMRIRLRPKQGNYYTRTCRFRLGDDNCAVDIDALAVTGEVTAIGSQRLEFNTDLTAVSRYFEDGVLTWTSGNNDARKSEVKEHTNTNGRIVLHVESPFDIQVGDEFSVVPGCDRLFTTCKSRFNNGVRFGGYPYIPGNDALFRTPDPRDEPPPDP